MISHSFEWLTDHWESLRRPFGNLHENLAHHHPILTPIGDGTTLQLIIQGHSQSGHPDLAATSETLGHGGSFKASKRYLGLSISLKQIGNPSQRLTLLQVSQTLEEGCDHKIIREAPPAARELVQPPDEVSNE